MITATENTRPEITLNMGVVGSGWTRADDGVKLGFAVVVRPITVSVYWGRK